MAQSKAIQHDEEPDERSINPKFESRLKAIFEEINLARMTVEPVLKSAQVVVAEFREFLKFEIDKTELEIAKDAWEPIVNVDKQRDDKEWLGRLKALYENFSDDSVMSSATMMDDLYSCARSMFFVMRGTEL